jgi:hypothetical protein
VKEVEGLSRRCSQLHPIAVSQGRVISRRPSGESSEAAPRTGKLPLFDDLFLDTNHFESEKMVIESRKDLHRQSIQITLGIHFTHATIMVA